MTKTIIHEDWPLEVQNAYLYQSPRSLQVTGQPTEPDIDTVEILLEGRAVLTDMPETGPWGRGTLFWHIGGERTLSNLPGEAPYRCLSLRFKMSCAVRRRPRIMQWSNLNSLDPFVMEAVTAAGNPGIDRDRLCRYLWTRVSWEADLFLLDGERARVPEPLRRFLELARRPENYSLRLAEAARRCGTGEVNLFRLCRLHLRCSPHAYILRERLRRARELLDQPELELKQVAAECGFRYLETFHRAFVRQFGLTPGEFRRKRSGSPAARE